MKTFSITTLGCRVNHYESEQLATLLRGRGLTPAPADRADLRVVHTCSVTVQAATKSRQAVRRNVRLSILGAPSEDHQHDEAQADADPAAAVRAVAESALSDRSPAAAAARAKVIVTGCWATSNPAEAAALPGVDAVLGHHHDVDKELSRLLDHWEEHTGPHASITVKRKLDVDEDSCEERHEVPARRAGMVTLPQLDDRQTGHQRAFLKVQDGCDAHCTYCIIPQLRPALWSKPIDDAVDEAARLVEAGHVEIVLTGVFLGAYAQPTALRRRQTTAAALGGLVDALCTRVRGLRRLRLSSLEPGDLSPELIDVLKRHRQVVPHFHLPLQSGSEVLLRRMNRQYGREDFLRMVDQVHAAFDRPAITTDIIVGFPGETDAEFAHTVDIVDRVGFTHIHAFSYSPRPRTAAARWTKELVRGPIVNERIDRLRALSATHSLAFRQRFVGQEVELLVERPSGEEQEMEAMAGYQHGRCERYFAVHFEGSDLPPGSLARVRVDRVTPTRTFGTLVGVGS